MIAFHPYMSDSTPAGVWFSDPFNGQWMSGSRSCVTDGSKIRWKAYVNAGTYYAVLHTRKAADTCVADLDVDGSEEASWDLYGAIGSLNYLAKSGVITVASSKVMNIDLRADGKSVLSSSYRLPVTMLCLYPITITETAVNPGHELIHAQGYDSEPQGTWAITSGAEFGWGHVYNTTKAVGDKINYKVALGVGTWTFKMHVLGSIAGAVKAYLNTTSILDTSWAAGAADLVLTTAGITVTYPTLYTLSVEANTAAQFTCVEAMCLYRTA